MGFSATRITAPVDQLDDGSVRRELERLIAFKPVLPAREWFVIDVVRRERPSARLSDIIRKMQDLADRHDMPSLIAHVEDSDCSMTVGIAPGAAPALVVFNADVAEDYGELADVLDHFDADPAQLAAWAMQVGLPRLDLDELGRLAERECLHAEEPVDKLAARLQIDLLASPAYAELEGLLQIVDARTPIGDRSYRTTETQYAWGRGDGYYGIWDRRSPGPPIQRFPDDKDGRLAARREYMRLLLELPEDERCL